MSPRVPQWNKQFPLVNHKIIAKRSGIARMKANKGNFQYHQIIITIIIILTFISTLPWVG